MTTSTLWQTYCSENMKSIAILRVKWNAAQSSSKCRVTQPLKQSLEDFRVQCVWATYCVRLQTMCYLHSMTPNSISLLQTFHGTKGRDACPGYHVRTTGHTPQLCLGRPH